MDKQFVLYFVVPIVAGVGILVLGAILWAVALWRRRKHDVVDIEEWETTGGKVLSAKIEEQQSGGRTTFEPMIEYAYTVNNAEQRGNKVFAETGHQLSQSAAQEILKKHPVNSYVPVRYNPKNPAQSALMSAPERTDFVTMAASLFTGFGVLVCCFTSFMGIIIFGAVR